MATVVVLIINFEVVSSFVSVYFLLPVICTINLKLSKISSLRIINKMVLKVWDYINGSLHFILIL